VRWGKFSMTEPYTQYVRNPTPVVAVHLAAALGIGMLVGIEREWANKEFGLRSFAFVSLLGMIAAHLPTPLATMGFAAYSF
jgi:MgtC family